MRWNANSVRVGKRPSSLDCGCSLPLSLPKLAEEPAPFAEELPALAKARPPKRQQAAAVQGAAFSPGA
jgi:hypothetical protein